MQIHFQVSLELTRLISGSSAVEQQEAEWHLVARFVPQGTCEEDSRYLRTIQPTPRAHP